MPFPTGYRHKARSQKNGGYRERQNRAITVSLGIFVPQPSALPFINATTAVFATRHIANGSLATRYAITRQPRHPARRSSRACRPICHSGQAGQMARHGDQACRRHAANGSLRFPGRLPFRDGGAGWERQRRSAFLAMGFPEFVLRTAGQACPQWDEGNARGGSTAAAALLGEFVRESLLHRDDRHGVRLLFSVCFAACRRCSLDVAHSVASSDAAFNLPSSGERLLRSQDAGGDSIHAIESRSSRKRDAKGAGRKRRIHAIESRPSCKRGAPITPRTTISVARDPHAAERHHGPCMSGRPDVGIGGMAVSRRDGDDAGRPPAAAGATLH